MKFATAVFSAMAITAAIGCASGGNTPPEPPARIVELENKGTERGFDTPDWVRKYIAGGISMVQNQSEFRDNYCVIGEESGVNKQYVLAWADNFNAGQRIGVMLRTTIVGKFETARSGGRVNSSAAAETGSGDYRQEINNLVNMAVNLSYSGVQHENDWWSLCRRYDPDQENVYTDEYTAYVLCAIPKAELNRQIAQALETGVSADSTLYGITIALAGDILHNGMDYLGAGELAPASVQPQPGEEQSAGTGFGKVTVRNNSWSNSNILTTVKIYKGFEAKGEPFLVYEYPVLNSQQATWNLGEGVYTFAAFMNNSKNNAGIKTVYLASGDEFAADFIDGSISSFSKK